MALLWMLLASMAFVANGELVVRVEPELVYPAVTPSFSVNCALLENEEAKIVSMALSRRTGAQGNLQSGAAQRIVTLSSLTPGTPEVNPEFQGLTTLGQITSFESELGSYIHIVWPSPTIEDLGLYTCETVVIGEMGTLATIIAQSWVTTSDPMVDRLLLAVGRLESKLDVFNGTLYTLQAQVDNITASQIPEEEFTIPLVEETNATSPEIVADIPVEQVVQSTPSTDGRASSLERLASALESVNSKLDQFNSTMVAMETKLDKIKEKTVRANETTSSESEFTHVDTFFTYNNSIYFLISSSRPFNTYSAQALCESRGLFLAELRDSSELEAVQDNTASVDLEGRLVLVGGRRRAGTGVWRYQHSETEVTFFGDAILSESVTKDASCLALESGQSGLGFVDVICTDALATSVTLCQDDFNEASGEAESIF